MQRVALITGITGQDGAYLTALLLGKGYRVVGAFRRTSTLNFWRLEQLGVLTHQNLVLVEHDLTDPGASIRLLDEHAPQEIYNLAVQSFVGVSFKQPISTSEITGLGAVHLLEAIRIVDHKIRYYQASTSEMFGKVQTTPQDEGTAFHPRSPYGASKLFAHWMTVNYRESYGIFGASGILFNPESPLRGKEFVTRKITDAVARIKLGKLEALDLGNLGAERDWGFAKEYVEGMYRMLQHDEPDTFVMATGRSATVREFVEAAFHAVDISLSWRGAGTEEQGIDFSGKVRVRVNPAFFRPAEVDTLRGNAAKAKKLLGWEPRTSLQELCQMMVKADLRRQELGISL